MINGKTVIGVIPARGGSKGLPDKNIKLLAGRPLIGWTIANSTKSRYLDEVIVSTDSAKIAEIAKEQGGSVPFIRPLELATDSASSVDVVLHAIEYYEQQGRKVDIAILLEPTSPLREVNDIDLIIETLVESWDELDGVVSIGEASSHPSLVKKTTGKLVGPYIESVASEARRQDLPDAYFPYGVGYAVKSSYLMEHRSFYPRRCGFHVVQRYQCYEIDDIYDFLCIESIMNYRNSKVVTQ